MNNRKPLQIAFAIRDGELHLDGVYSDTEMEGETLKEATAALIDGCSIGGTILPEHVDLPLAVAAQFHMVARMLEHAAGKDPISISL